MAGVGGVILFASLRVMTLCVPKSTLSLIENRSQMTFWTLAPDQEDFLMVSTYHLFSIVLPFYSIIVVMVTDFRAKRIKTIGVFPVSFVC